MGKGRETKLTPELQERIVKDLADGQTRVCASARANIGIRSFQKWLALGKQGKQPYAAFYTAVKKAERDAESAAVSAIREAGQKLWTAYAWWLERKFPDSWGKRDRLELSGNKRKPVEVVEVIVSTREQAENLLADNGKSGPIPE